MGLIRILFLIALLTSPVRAEDIFLWSMDKYEILLEAHDPVLFSYFRECVRKTSEPNSRSDLPPCIHFIFMDEITPQQRADIRARFSALDSNYIPRMLYFLRHDGERIPNATKPIPRGEYTSCIKHNDTAQCRAALFIPQLTAEETSDVRRQLERLDPGYIPRMIGYLSPSAAAPVPPVNPKETSLHEKKGPPPVTAPTPSPTPAKTGPSPTGGLSLDGLLGFLLLAIPAFFIVRHFIKKKKMKQEWDALPEEGPMKVSIEERMLEPGSFNSKRIKCDLKIDVKISKKDWKAIADAGLMKKVLFNADSPTGEPYDPENVWPWKVEDLKKVTSAPFWDTDRMSKAKEELIQSLYNLREQIDSVRAGPTKETMEI